MRKLMIVGLVVLLAGAGVGGWLVFSSKSKAADAGDTHHESAPIVGLMFPTKERVVNLSDSGGYRYLKTEVIIELGLPAKELEGIGAEAYKKKQEVIAKELAPITPLLDDAMTTLLSSKKASDLLTAEGKAALRSELKEQLQAVIHAYPVNGVYLAQFIIQ